MFGIDYSAGRATPAGLKAAGVSFVARYISTPGNSKNISRAEADALRKAGIHIVTVFETTARRALSGRAAGIVDARSAHAQVVAAGGPVDAPIYFAVDFDATPHDQAAINAYLAGAASVLGLERVGVYGGYWVVKRALDARVATYGWQTYAWSGSHWDARAQLRQVSNGRHLVGLEVDFDQAQALDYGQWDRPKPKPAPKPVPRPHPDTGPFPEDDAFWTWLRWYVGAGEFEPYGARNHDVRPNVPLAIKQSWWRGLRRFLAAKPTTT